MQGIEHTGFHMNIQSYDSDSSLRRDSVKYLGERGQTSPQVTRSLLNILRESAGPNGVLLRDAVVKSLGQLGDASPEVISALIALLHHNILLLSDESTLQSLRQLSQWSSEAVPMIANDLQYPEPRLRVAVASTLESFVSASSEII